MPTPDEIRESMLSVVAMKRRLAEAEALLRRWLGFAWSLPKGTEIADQTSAFLGASPPVPRLRDDAWDSHAFCWAHGMCMARSTDPLPQHGNVCQDMTAALGKPGHLGAASPDWAAATPWPPKCAMCRDKRYIQVTCGDDFSATESKPCPACQHPTPSTSP